MRTLNRKTRVSSVYSTVAPDGGATLLGSRSLDHLCRGKHAREGQWWRRPLTLLAISILTVSACGQGHRLTTVKLSAKQTQLVNTAAEEKVGPVFDFPAGETLVCASVALGSTMVSSVSERIYLVLFCAGRQGRSDCSQNQAIQTVAVATVSAQQVSKMSVDQAEGDPGYQDWIQDNLPRRLWNAVLDDPNNEYGQPLVREVNHALGCPINQGLGVT